jgi:hypothetical protein
MTRRPGWHPFDPWGRAPLGTTCVTRRAMPPNPFVGADDSLRSEASWLHRASPAVTTAHGSGWLVAASSVEIAMFSLPGGVGACISHHLGAVRRALEVLDAGARRPGRLADGRQPPRRLTRWLRTVLQMPLEESATKTNGQVTPPSPAPDSPHGRFSTVRTRGFHFWTSCGAHACCSCLKYGGHTERERV